MKLVILNDLEIGLFENGTLTFERKIPAARQVGTVTELRNRTCLTLQPDETRKLAELLHEHFLAAQPRGERAS